MAERDDPELPPELPDPSSAALGRYRARMRRARLVYFSIVGVIVAALIAFVAVVWANGETAHVTLDTAATVPPSLALDTPSSTQHQVWHTSDRSAIGEAQYGGTVVTYSQHTVRGVDARTGRTTWSYTRTDRTTCTVAQDGGYAIAIFRDDGNCDEVTALNPGNGDRLWTRTLDEDGKPINGTPDVQINSGSFMVTSASSIYDIGLSSGIDVFTFHHNGCTIEHAVLGTSGALISQNCNATEQDCGSINAKFCGPGQQLLLRNLNPYDDSNDTNPDQVVWRLPGNSDVPVSTGTVIAAVDPSNDDLVTFGANNSKTRSSVPLNPAPQALTPSAAIDTADAEVLWIAGRIYAVENSTGTIEWTATSAAAPTVVAPDGATVVLSDALVTISDGGRIAQLSGTTGRANQTFSVGDIPDGATVSPLGSGFLVSSPSGTTAYA